MAWLNIMLAFINSGASAAAIFFALYLKTQFQLTDFFIGCVMAGFGIGAMCGSLYGGILSDRISAKVVCLVSLFVNAITLLIISFVTNAYLIMILFTLMGASNSAFAPANRVTIMRLTAVKDHARVSGLRYMMINLGIGAYIWFDGIIASALGYKWLFILNGLAILAISLLYLFTSFRTSENLDKNNDSENSHVMSKQDSTFFIWLYASLLLTSLIFSQLRITYPLYLHEYYHLNEKLFSYLFLINTVLIFLFQMPVLNLLQKVNSLLIAGMGALLIGIGIGLIFIHSNYLFVIFLCIIWTLGEILYFSTLQAVIYSKAHTTRKGKYMGIMQMTIAFTNIIGPLFGSWLYGFDDAKWLWLSCLLIGMIAFSMHYKIYLDEKINLN